MSEASSPPTRLIEVWSLFQNSVTDRGKYHLGYPVSSLDPERSLAEVDEDHSDLTPVVGVDGAGSVEHRDPVPQGKPRTRPHLGFVAVRYLDREARRNQSELTRRDLEVRFDARKKVEPR